MMKKYKVKLKYECDGYNGYEHHEDTEICVVARNESSAVNKARKLAKKSFGSWVLVNYDVEEVWDI